eukprot:CAMPEP_0201584638 /NCGR_PEP_ID=MMETSP0190_2-20130828/113124_1 /ASSEMBLY_ACC=CAM_ASM_000263 /TAXON_ID=37353 /ORGANISM="Rosalina sp." /LENGTH=181 /DNA_ID=CAMNT_0048029007 /DNA_START=71 /DNA_END=616 /DNA_ORIENTATION=+
MSRGHNITIWNKDKKKTIMCRVASQKSNLTSSQYSQAVAQQRSTKKGVNLEAKVEVQGAPVKAGGKVGLTLEKGKSKSVASSSSKTRDFSAFIEDGYVQIRPKKSKDFWSDAQVAYISIAIDDQIPINNWGTRGIEFQFVKGDLEEVKTSIKHRTNSMKAEEEERKRQAAAANSGGCCTIL